MFLYIQCYFWCEIFRVEGWVMATKCGMWIHQNKNRKCRRWEANRYWYVNENESYPSLLQSSSHATYCIHTRIFVIFCSYFVSSHPLIFIFFSFQWMMFFALRMTVLRWPLLRLKLELKCWHGARWWASIILYPSNYEQMRYFMVINF